MVPSRSFFVIAVLAACQTQPPSAPRADGASCVSLDGRPLLPAPIAETARVRMEQQLAEARARLAQSPEDREAAIWVGRRLAYLGRYSEAIEVFGAALAHHPNDPYLLRHRGHRYLSLRCLDRAIGDLTLAAERCRTEPDSVEPDGVPTPGRPPHSSLHFNVHYHLGLSQFLVGDFTAAERAWLDCLAVCDDDESRVAVTHWLWSARMRDGNPAGAAAVVAALGPDLDVVENKSYHQLCLLYAGKLDRAAIEAREGSSGAALAFGLAHHALVAGDRARAERDLRALAVDPGWASFGVLAAEAECLRQGWALR